MIEFQGFGKIPRLFRDIIITEKIDGTNGNITIVPVDFEGLDLRPLIGKCGVHEVVCGDIPCLMRAGSRKRWIAPENDNYGFAKWVAENKYELAKLGPGRHFGEWWGQGIQRNYGLKEKRFSLFNTAKWSDDAVRPARCHVVPVLYAGPFDMCYVDDALEKLELGGSFAASGFMKPEGVVVFHTAGNLLFKATIENDDKPKGQV